LSTRLPQRTQKNKPTWPVRPKPESGVREGGLRVPVAATSVARSLQRLQREADRIAVLILSTDLPEIDIVIQVEKLRERCEELFPGRGDLFEMIYASRFDRLKEQFGADRPGAD